MARIIIRSILSVDIRYVIIYSAVPASDVHVVYCNNTIAINFVLNLTAPGRDHR
jgi:hypothetical protein